MKIFLGGWKFDLVTLTTLIFWNGPVYFISSQSSLLNQSTRAVWWTTIKLDRHLYNSRLTSSPLQNFPYPTSQDISSTLHSQWQWYSYKKRLLKTTLVNGSFEVKVWNWINYNLPFSIFTPSSELKQSFVIVSSSQLKRILILSLILLTGR